MTKRRTPDTLEAALEVAIGHVGIDRVAQWIGKSAAMVRKFADPDSDHRLWCESADEIDRNLALAGYLQPFAELVAFRAARHARAALQLSHALADAVAVPAERPLKLAATMACDASNLVAAIDAAEADGVYSAGEIDDLCTAVNGLSRRAVELRRAVAARARGGKGRPRGVTP